MKQKKKIAIIGSEGYVGKAQVSLWSYNNIYEVIKYDEPKGIGSREEVNKADLSVICVPTPEAKDGSADISIVEDVFSWLDTPVFLIKSTIPPHTVEYLIGKENKEPIVVWPEFIGENKYWSPYSFNKNPLETPFVILGGSSEEGIRYVYDLLLPILGPAKNYFFTDCCTACMVKYMSNAYLGLKVTFANEMKRICDALRIDYAEVRELWSQDPRVDKMHTAVFKDTPGFGGKCLPKDIQALAKFSEEAGYDPKFIKAILEANERFRKDLKK